MVQNGNVHVDGSLCLCRGKRRNRFARAVFGLIGFLGSYTTFSSFDYDGYLAARGGHHPTALAYWVDSVILDYAGVWMGAFLVAKH